MGSASPSRGSSARRFRRDPDELDFIKTQLARIPCQVWGVVTMTDDPQGTAQQLSGADYREVARKLRIVVRECRLPIPRRELLALATRYERRADHLDRRAAAR
jgi:hypothetical protein